MGTSYNHVKLMNIQMLYTAEKNKHNLPHFALTT